MSILLFFAGFLFLIKGADYLIEGASSIAKRLKISDLIIGLTIVAFGTSAPELFVNVQASLQNDTGIALGNILGSNIANIMLILGVAAVISTLVIRDSTVLVEIPLSALTIIVLWIIGNDFLLDKAEHSVLSRSDGLILLCFFIVFLFYIYRSSKAEIFPDYKAEKHMPIFQAVFYTLLGVTILPIGGDWVVEGAIKIANFFNLSQFAIAATIVAFGTSLPELTTCVMAALKKKSDIAVGNIVGSNIFNVLWVLGVSAFINPITITQSNNTDIVIVFVVTVLVIVMLRFRKKLLVLPEYVMVRWQGLLMILGYIGYIVSLFFRGKI